MATVGSAIVCDRLRLYGNRSLCDRLRSAIVCDRLRSYGNQPLKKKKREERKQIKLLTFKEFLAQSHFISSFHTVRVDKLKQIRSLFVIKTSDVSTVD